MSRPERVSIGTVRLAADVVASLDEEAARHPGMSRTLLIQTLLTEALSARKLRPVRTNRRSPRRKS